MSDTTDEPCLKQDDVSPTQRLSDNIDWSQFYDMFMKIEQRLPNFDHMLMAMNDYAFQRTSRQRQTNDLIEFCGVLKKGFFDWYTSSINNEMKVPNFIDLTNQVFDDDILKKIDKKLDSSKSLNTDTSKITDTSDNTDASDCANTIASTDAGESTNTSVNTDAIESTSISANIDSNENTGISLNTDAFKSTDTGANTDACKSTNTSANTDVSESTGTSPNTGACKSTHTNANTDASDCANTIASTDAGESTNTSVNTDDIESTSISANIDSNENTNTSPNTGACKSTDTDANTDACKSTNISANANANGSTNTNTNSDACKSRSISANTCSRTSGGTCTNKRAKTSKNTYSAMAKNSKHLYKHIENRSSSLENVSQSTETNVDTDQSFKIIMPTMSEYNTFLRKRLPIDCNIHLGNDFERHWWRQTNDKIVLYVDISDLIVEKVPNVKVLVTIVGFKVKVRRNNKWIILVSNKFENSIKKSKWVVNRHMHVKLTIYKREKEFWSKCLVTETKELDTSSFKNHSCSNECSAPQHHGLELGTTKGECVNGLTTYLEDEYFIDQNGLFMDGTDSMVPSTTEENPHDSAITLKLSVDPSTEKSLNSDSEDPLSTKEYFMDSEVEPKLTE